jgi:hypothetical protein
MTVPLVSIAVKAPRAETTTTPRAARPSETAY